ncbi:MAG: polyprenyl synthetase family protein [Rhodospirillales bacterium]|nr:polyprenyl synthetase family protein [Rhodospirillales bacterium]
MTSFKETLTENARIVTEELDRLLPLEDGAEARLMEAVRYATLSAGKRIRPFLVMNSAHLFNVSKESAVRVAAAVEMVHCYSLVHDDLPAMDDDELRRGQPTCHVRFGEAAAILAGDGLLTKAFGVLADEPTHSDPKVRGELVVEMSHAVGIEGMVGGQMLDLLAEESSLGVNEITRLQRLKTGMLIDFACASGAILGKASKPARHALHAYAHDLGLAFQIADDLLDVEGDEKEVGKKTGKDASAGKATFVSLLGRERARAQADMLADQAIEHLVLFEEKAEHLRELAKFVVSRRA